MSAPRSRLVPSPFGPLGLVWQETAQDSLVERIYLPHGRTGVEERIRAEYGEARPASCARIATLARRLQRFLAGENVPFELRGINLARCSPFQARVLMAEHRIPRGRVSTYGRIARALGIARGARAVGNALACNPFPIIIPCHRAVRANGELGGYQGGPEMKRALLVYEGVEVTPDGRVLMHQVYDYPQGIG
jgi:methylated-DNA-[protein]-cysteine S-methyltransferase